MSSKFLVGLLIAALSSAASATDFNEGPFTVSSIRIGGDGASVSVVLNPAPASCNGGNYYGAHAVVYANTDGGKLLYSSLLAAYMSGKQLSGIWTNGSNGCSSNNNDVLTLVNLQFVNQ